MRHSTGYRAFRREGCQDRRRFRGSLIGGTDADEKALVDGFNDWFQGTGPLPEPETIEEYKFLFRIASASFAEAMGDLHVAAKVLKDADLFDKFEDISRKMKESVKARRAANVQ